MVSAKLAAGPTQAELRARATVRPVTRQRNFGPEMFDILRRLRAGEEVAFHEVCSTHDAIIERRRPIADVEAEIVAQEVCGLEIPTFLRGQRPAYVPMRPDPFAGYWLIAGVVVAFLKLCAAAIVVVGAVLATV